MLQYEVKMKKITEYESFPFEKAHFTPFQFCKYLMPVFTNQKKSEEDFYIL